MRRQLLSGILTSVVLAFSSFPPANADQPPATTSPAPAQPSGSRPSFRNPYQEKLSEYNDPDSQLGYTEAERLACLQQNGFDPIDLSPLPRGQQLYSSFRDFGMGARQIGLPFFADYGTDVGNMTIGDKRADTIGAKDAWARWCIFRQQEHSALVGAIADKAKSSASGLPILVRFFDDPVFVGANGYFNADRILHTTPAPAQAIPSAGQASRTRARGNTVDPSWATGFFSLTSTATAANGGIPTVADRLNSLDNGLLQAGNWGAVVLDVSNLSLADSLDLLGKLPPPGEPAAPAATPQ